MDISSTNSTISTRTGCSPQARTNSWSIWPVGTTDNKKGSGWCEQKGGPVKRFITCHAVVLWLSLIILIMALLMLGVL